MPRSTNNYYANQNRGVSPPRDAREQPRPGSHIYQQYQNDYRSVSPMQEDPKAQPKKKSSIPQMIANMVDGPGQWALPPKKM